MDSKIGAIPHSPTGHLDEESRSIAVNSTRWQTVRQRGGWEFYKSLLFVTTVLFTGMAAASCSIFHGFLLTEDFSCWQWASPHGWSIKGLLSFLFKDLNYG